MKRVSDSLNTKRWRLNVEVAAGGGFAGIREGEVQTAPTLNCAGDPQVCTPDSETVTLVRNNKYTWRPSLSTGIIFRWYKSTDAEIGDKIGLGIGGHFVFVPSGNDSRAAPALTMHIGKQSTQLFFGMIFVPTDRVDLPGESDRVVVPAGTNPSDFVRSDGGSGPSFYAGVVIGGLAVTKTTASPSDPD
jgi:hypothetical protein